MQPVGEVTIAAHSTTNPSVSDSFLALCIIRSTMLVEDHLFPTFESFDQNNREVTHQQIQSFDWAIWQRQKGALFWMLFVTYFATATVGHHGNIHFKFSYFIILYLSHWTLLLSLVLQSNQMRFVIVLLMRYQAFPYTFLNQQSKKKVTKIIELL